MMGHKICFYEQTWLINPVTLFLSGALKVLLVSQQNDDYTHNDTEHTNTDADQNTQCLIFSRALACLLRFAYKRKQISKLSSIQRGDKWIKGGGGAVNNSVIIFLLFNLNSRAE